jgi:Bacterial PH domain
MTHKTSLSDFVKGTTMVLNILFIMTVIGLFTFIKEAGLEFQIGMTSFLVLIFSVTFAFRPIDYKITDAQLIIHRLIKDVVIEKSNIISVSVLDEKKVEWSIRTFGVGGYYGYFGKFANSKMGSMTWYATRKDKTVLIITADDEKIILTPDDPEAFVVDYYL